jgi:LPS sulfotransferase NodH
MHPRDWVWSAFGHNSVIRRKTIIKIKKTTVPYVIYFTARSGSTWLMEMAERTGVLGKPDEWFNENIVGSPFAPLDVNELLLEHVRLSRSSNGVVGLELSYFQASCVAEMLELPRPRLGEFYLRRKDIIAQAVSLYRSVESGLYHSHQATDDSVTRHAAMEYSEQKIEHWCHHALNDEIAFARLFTRCGIKPKRFFYEDIAQNPDEVLSWIASHIHGAPQKLKAQTGRIERISDEKSREWEQKFRSDRADFVRVMENLRPALESDYL